jgi:branched-chain amino acid aminotransferase
VRGNISEGSGDNIFIIKNGTISTPQVMNNLRGITRAAAIEIAQDLGYPLLETDLGLFDLYTADEVFVTGTAAEIAPIATVDGRPVGDGSVGTITKELMPEGTPI